LRDVRQIGDFVAGAALFDVVKHEINIILQKQFTFKHQN
jgi:hypothetical protein